jgi:hypothetical protein
MGPSVRDLAFKTRAGIALAVCAHTRPVGSPFQELKHLLPPYVVVLHVDFLQQEKLKPLGWIVFPVFTHQFQQLPLSKLVAPRSCLELWYKVLGCMGP